MSLAGLTAQDTVRDATVPPHSNAELPTGQPNYQNKERKIDSAPRQLSLSN